MTNTMFFRITKIKILGFIFFTIFLAVSYANAAPSCEQVSYGEGPPVTIRYAIWESNIGLKAIRTDVSDNMRVSVPIFLAGTTNHIYVDAVQLDVQECVNLRIVAEDMNGATSECEYSNCVNPDNTAPAFFINGSDPGPPATLYVGVQDEQSGLALLETTQATNTNVSIPGFQAGTKNAVIVSAEQINSSQESTFTLNASDNSGNSSTFVYNFAQPIEDTTGPTWEIASIQTDEPVTITFHIQDQLSGLKSISVTDSQNAAVDIPVFPQGITSPPVAITVTQVSASEDMRIELLLEDMAGNTSVCHYELPASDSDPPQCSIEVYDSGPPAFIRIRIQDSGSGLASLEVIEALNVAYDVPDVEPGDLEGVTMGITQIEANLNYSIRIRTYDVNGNMSECTYPDNLPVLKSPEFDTVGTDSTNLFTDISRRRISANLKDSAGRLINDYSDFSQEYFLCDAGVPINDPCFSAGGSIYQSVFTPPWSEALYEWRIVLQMKPASDIGLQVAACVLEGDQTDPFKYGAQTGHYRLPWSPEIIHVTPSAVPRVSVRAYPGPRAAAGFPQQGFALDIRRVPDQGLSPGMDVRLFLSCLNTSHLSLVMPINGEVNSMGETVRELHAGDIISVQLAVPFNNTAGLRLGDENVSLNYLGRAGSAVSTAQD